MSGPAAVVVGAVAAIRVGLAVTVCRCAHADVCDLEWVIWRRSSYERGEGPGAKLDAASPVAGPP